MHWYHTLEELELSTPSRNDSIDFETEYRYRTEGARFIMDLGNKLGLRYVTMATGIVYFHRFYMFHSFKEFPRWVVGAACLFLAGKVEETPKKCGDILKVTQKTISDAQFQSFGENPREEVMICERILLQTIKFDLKVDHPYQFLIKYGKRLKGNKEKVNELIQKAWIFINDSLATPVCLIHKPQVVALGVLLMAVRMSNQSIRDFMHQPKVDWWEVFYQGATEDDLEYIYKELLDMYEGRIPNRRYAPEKSDTAPPSNTESSPKGVSSPKIDNSGTPGSPAPKKAKTVSTPTTTIVSTVENVSGAPLTSNAVDAPPAPPVQVSSVSAVPVGSLISNSTSVPVTVPIDHIADSSSLPSELGSQQAAPNLSTLSQPTVIPGLEPLNQNAVGVSIPDRGFPVVGSSNSAPYYPNSQMNGYGYMQSGQQMMTSYNYGQQGQMPYNGAQQPLYNAPPASGQYGNYAGNMMGQHQQHPYNMYGNNPPRL